MHVSVRLFAGLRDLIGEKSVVLELADGATVAEMREQFGRSYPHATPFLTTLACAVDDEYVPVAHSLREGDDVSLIPPVSGGSGLFLLTDAPLDAEALVRSVRQDESGAVVLFHGVARNNSDGRGVRALEYQAHESLAEKKLREVGDEVRRRFPITDIGIMHRTGHLEIGEASLLVAVAAPHRKEAFAAAEHAVDRIKQIVPIWKKEIWFDGGGEWVAGHTVETPEAAGSPGL